MDEVALLEAWRGGDSGAGRRLVGHYYAHIYRFFFAKVSDDACEDLTQETFEVVIRRRDDYRGDASFRAYLYGIARLVLVGHIRRRRRHHERFDPTTHSVVDPVSEAASLLFAAREQERTVAAALRSLPLDDQIAIELKDWEGLSQDELATLFDVPRSTIASRLQRARARLRKTVDELLADPERCAGLDEGLETALRSIHAKIQDHIGRPAPE